MRQVAYTNHIGTSSHDKYAKNTTVSSAADLANLEKHNNHNYSQEDVERMESNINLDLKEYNKHYDRNFNQVGYLNYYESVREIYKEQFSEAVAEYNEKQKRSDRKILDYFEHISKDKKQEVCVEGVIQFGSFEDWEGKTIEEKLAVENLYLKTLRKLLELDGLEFAGASFHINESTPHLHWVGVPIKERKEVKKGLRKAVNKSHVFTKETLGDFLQDELRNFIEPDLEELFGWKFIEKKTGRNKDLSKNEYIINKQLDRAAELEIKISELERERDEKESNLYMSELDLEFKERELQQKEEELKDVSQELKNTSFELKEKEGRVIDAQKELEATAANYERLGREFSVSIAEAATIKVEEPDFNRTEDVELAVACIQNIPNYREELVRRYKEKLESDKKESRDIIDQAGKKLELELRLMMANERIVNPAVTKQKQRDEDLEL